MGGKKAILQCSGPYCSAAYFSPQHKWVDALFPILAHDVWTSEIVAQWYLDEVAATIIFCLLYHRVLCFADHAAGVLIK
jgi:hypothetical protein